MKFLSILVLLSLMRLNLFQPLFTIHSIGPKKAIFPNEMLASFVWGDNNYAFI